MDWMELAKRQNGVITRDQLLSTGEPLGRVRRFVGSRILVAIMPGVYLHGSMAPTPRQRWRAASLWSGGVLSHRTAGLMWGIQVAASEVVDVTVPAAPARRAPPGVRLHRRDLVRSEWSVVDGMRVTSRTCTLLDLLRVSDRGQAQQLWDLAMRKRWLDERSVEVALRRAPCRPGNTRLRTLLTASEPGTHAESERVLHRLLRRAGLTDWRAQFPVSIDGFDFVVDVAFPAARLVIEIDGRRYHGEHSAAFEHDRARQNLLSIGGWRVLRFTWARLTREPDAVIAEIRRMLGVTGRHQTSRPR